ncbi:MAG TPA: PP2C family protein-serine/threonine phosphatase [Streptomyces sp.]|uniref:PP2C family protein-serine/threonine phosphatase n=1 Tax=Streptomyces sp. TaxID=1931 RepID=UPI002D3BF914|nr:PP2C family protein-serine/threonine phosphatase [Streptomyces sp.]HZG07054.1 PP2C family protein-serine/threonine phosphatase [Streptomyces sp.]
MGHPHRPPEFTLAERDEDGYRLLAGLPFASMAVVTLVDVTAGPDAGFLPLLSLGPAFAGLVGGMRRTALIGLLALVLCLALAVYDGLLGSPRGYTAVASVAGVAAAGLAAAAVRQRHEAELASVRSIAEVAQRVLLRPVPRAAGHLRVAVSYTSAVAEARIGGDLYEVVTSPTGVRVIVGDVQGKGLEAVETAAVVLAAFREAAYDEPDLMAVSARLERSVNRHMPAERFVTAVLVETHEDRSVTVLNHGHPSPLVVRADGTAHLAEPPETAPPLGMGFDLKPPEPYGLSLGRGDQMLLYTDGVTEARDPDGTFYPLARRSFLLREANPDCALEALRRDLVTHVGGPLHDDAAMLLLRYRGG